MTTTTTHDVPTTIEYRGAQLQDLRVIAPQEDKEQTRHDGAVARAIRPRRAPAAVEVDGERFYPTSRFWRSLFHRFGISDNVFRYFGYDEVFARVVQSNGDDRLRLCIERRGGTNADGSAKGTPHLLAVSNPRRGVLTYDQTLDMAARHGGAKPEYHNGVVTTNHTPRSGEHGFFIGPDQFNNRFVVEVPVDGFGQPRVYLSLLRQVCSNGAVGYSRAFRSDIRVGSDAAYTVERAMGQFDHDEGFAALRQRFESAQKSWASVQEVMQLQRTISRAAMQAGGLDSRGLADQLNRVAGDLHGLYGVANLDSLSSKRQRVLPAKCRVYDLLNFASEVATHRAPAQTRSRLQAYIGTLISDEYDLEGTAEKVPEFTDLFMNLN